MLERITDQGGKAILDGLVLPLMPALVATTIETGLGAVILLIHAYWGASFWSLTGRRFQFRVIVAAIRREWRHLTAIIAIGLANVGTKAGFALALLTSPLGLVNGIYYATPLLLSFDMLWRKKGHRLVACQLPLLAASGMLVLLEPWRGDAGWVGAMWALLAGGCKIVYLKLSRKYIRTEEGGSRISAEKVIAWSTVVSAIAVGVWALGAGDGFSAAWTWKALLFLLLTGLLITALPRVFQLASRRLIPDGTYGIILTTTPALGAVVDALFLGTSFTLTQCGGILAIMVAAFFTTWISQRPPKS